MQMAAPGWGPRLRAGGRRAAGAAGLRGAEELSAPAEEERRRKRRIFREPITVRDNAKLCIFLQPFSPPFTFPIVTHPWPPHTPLLAQAVNRMACV